MRVTGRRIVLAALLAVWPCVTVAEDAADAEQETVAQIRHFATNFQFHKDGTVRLVRLSKPGVSDETLALLPKLPHIDYLAVIVPQVTDAGIDASCRPQGTRHAALVWQRHHR